MKIKSSFYFENFIAACDLCCQAADYLVECLKNYDPARIKDMLDRMHAIEHAADGKKHDMTQALATTASAPFGRKDLDSLSQNIDEVADKLEEILQRFYVHGIRTVLPDAITFAEKLAACTMLMKNLLGEFENYKKPAFLNRLIVDLNNVEEDCDRFYLDATFRAREQCTEVLDIIAWREIYDYMEDCADACEHVADSVGTVVMKNS